ncbi:MAG: alginate lyase family protein [Rhizobium sp.]|nr:alginate lyase family protein [Rhizobium sp.]
MLARGSSFRSGAMVAVAMIMATCVSTTSYALASEPRQGKPSSSGTTQQVCQPVPDLPRRLATQSKYDQSIASRSVIDEPARQRRAETLAPVIQAISQVHALVREETGDMRNSSHCAILALRQWADAGALTEMTTSDASLTRDRFTGEIAAIVIALQARGESLEDEGKIRTWLSTLARQTMAYYDWKAGPVSRRNNHRYWAGAAVADIGDILGDRAMQTWSEASFAIGACQIDEGGFLPLELARADRAYEYHLYAYGALNRLAYQAARRGKADLDCSDRLDRLHALVSRGGESAHVFTQHTGLAQRTPSRSHLAAGRTPPPGTQDLETTSDVNPM